MVQRFVEAHNRDFEKAFREIRNGKKVSHWMWYIFPQLKELGYSSTAKYYGMESIEDVIQYMSHPVLSRNMKKLCRELLDIQNRSALDIFGDIDAKKLQSCMTLFYLVTNDELFLRVLVKYYDGKLDFKTEKLIEKL